MEAKVIEALKTIRGPMRAKLELNMV